MGLKLAISGHSLTGERVDRRWRLSWRRMSPGIAASWVQTRKVRYPTSTKQTDRSTSIFRTKVPARTGKPTGFQRRKTHSTLPWHLRPEIGRPHWEVEPAAGQKNSEGNWSDSAIRIRASVARTRIAANVGSWHFSDMALVLGDVRSWGAE